MFQWLLGPHTSLCSLICVFLIFPLDSLAAEIEGTMRKELQLEEPETPDIAS